MLGKAMDRLARRPARYFYSNFMESGGIHNTMRLSKWYNRIRYAESYRTHKRMFRDSFDKLLYENSGASTAGNASPGSNGNGSAGSKNNIMRDGFAIDTSHTLPHLEALLAETSPLIDKRGGVKDKKRAYPGKPFFQSIRADRDFVECPSILNFAMSSPVLETIGRYMGTIPVLSKTMPPGVRFVESYAAYENEPNPPYRSSQLYHLDIHDDPLVYLIVLLRDVTMQHGPWCFLPMSTSNRAVEGLNYRSRRCPYRVTDEMMYKLVDPKELIPFTYPAGAVLFIDSGRCFHYGSRDSVLPRYMMMYGFTTPCRTDMTMTYMNCNEYPIKDTDSTLRKMVLG